MRDRCGKCDEEWGWCECDPFAGTRYERKTTVEDNHG